jgi:hypothetical protein
LRQTERDFADNAGGSKMPAVHIFRPRADVTAASTRASRKGHHDQLQNDRPNYLQDYEAWSTLAHRVFGK